MFLLPSWACCVIFTPLAICICCICKWRASWAWGLQTHAHVCFISTLCCWSGPSNCCRPWRSWVCACMSLGRTKMASRCVALGSCFLLPAAPQFMSMSSRVPGLQSRSPCMNLTKQPKHSLWVDRVERQHIVTVSVCMLCWVLPNEHHSAAHCSDSVSAQRCQGQWAKHWGQQQSCCTH